MFKPMNRFSVLKYITNDGLTYSPRTSYWIQICRRSTGVNRKKAEEFTYAPSDMSFSSFLKQRQSEAKRSFFVKVKFLELGRKFLSLCRSQGSILNAYHCEQSSNHYLVIEMQGERALNNILSLVYGPDHVYGCSKNIIILNEETLSHLSCKPVSSEKFNESVVTVENASSQKVLNTELCKKVNNLNNIIKNCYECLKVNEFEIRKKFIMCNQIQGLFEGFMENYMAYPFGSSISGFGLSGCDLDIAMLPCHFNGNVENFDFWPDCSIEMTRRHLGIITDILRNFTKWSTDINFVKNARVPIVKFKNTTTNVECDLSIYNAHGVAMTLMYHAFSSIDWRVRALVLFLKLWAYKVGIINKSPCTKPTGFSLSVLVIFFLQQIEMLPPLNVFPCRDSQYLLKDHQMPNLDFTELKRKCENDKTPEDLLKEFIDYYKSFDFLKWGISIKEGKPVVNTDKFPIYTENPIYSGVNISANVRNTDVGDIKVTLYEASQILSGKIDQEQVRKFFSLCLRGRRKLHASGGFLL